MGRSIDGFKILREIGRGGMGVVYEARHPELARSVALKVLSGADAESLLRFRREAELLARVRHPSVLRIHELGQTQEGLYLATELLEGEDLQEHLCRAPFEPHEAARLVRELCSGLSAVHAQGVVHRDLKPQNVVLTTDRRPVLLDFGLARELKGEALTQTGTTLGTPAFMPPEQACGEVPDERGDVYGLGAILFALLCGRPPFDGTLAQVLLAVVNVEPHWSPDVDVPEGLRAICDRALSKSPEDRYGSAAELATALASWERDESQPPSSRAWLALVLLPLIAVAILAAVLLRDGSPPPPTVPTVQPPPRTTAPPPADARAVQLASDVLDALEDLPAARRIPLLDEWLEAHPNHPRAQEARDTRRRAQLTVPLRTLKTGALPQARFVGEDLVLTTDREERLLLWDLTSDAPPQAIQRDPPAWRLGLAVTADGQQALFARKSFGVSALDLSTLQSSLLAGFPKDKPHTLLFGPRGRVLAAHAHHAHLHDWPSGVRTRTFEVSNLRKVALSEKGDLLVVAAGDWEPEGRRSGENSLRVFDTESGEELWKMPRGISPTALCFLPSGELLAGDAAGEIVAMAPRNPRRHRLWRSAKPYPERFVPVSRPDSPHGGRVWSLAVHPDEPVVFSLASREGASPRLAEFKVWDWREGTEIRRVTLEVPARDLRLSPGGTRLLVTGDKTGVRIYPGAVR